MIDTSTDEHVAESRADSSSQSTLPAQRWRVRGGAHHAIHNVPLARLVFVPENDGRLHRYAIDAIEASYSVTGGGVKAEGEHGRTPLAERVGASIPGSGDEEVAT